ncbi:MAG TPA: isoprenylcysteine carboxylmethyltransferase family protein [Terriglobales bacterium]|nr:isoprenylcysteine carboxylmethyltransferase family protein [Terriglobales bacterium]
MVRILDTVAWLAALVYSTIPAFWLVIHPRVQRWRSRPRSPYRALIPMWVGMWIVMGAITWPWRHGRLYSSPFTWIPAAFFFAAGLALYKTGGRNFTGAQLGGRPELEPGRHEQRLVTSGVRARVRHPIYLAHFCELLGWSIGTGLIVVYALTAFAVATGALMIRMEDDELEQRFGEPYRKYRQTVPAVIPKLLG